MNNRNQGPSESGFVSHNDSTYHQTMPVGMQMSQQAQQAQQMKKAKDPEKDVFQIGVSSRSVNFNFGPHHRMWDGDTWVPVVGNKNITFFNVSVLDFDNTINQIINSHMICETTTYLVFSGPDNDSMFYSVVFAQTRFIDDSEAKYLNMLMNAQETEESEGDDSVEVTDENFVQ